MAARQQRVQPDGLPRSVIFGHAGLAFIGFAGWVGFLAAGSPILAWLAIGFLAPAIGLGISIVTVWTPYPARRAGAGAGAEPPAAPDGAGDGPDRRNPGEEGPAEEEARTGSGGQRPPSDPSRSGHAHGDMPAGPGTDEMLARALADEALTSRLVDDLLASMLAVRPSAPRPKWHLAPLIPAAHGVAAIATFLLAMLAAVAAT